MLNYVRFKRDVPPPPLPTLLYVFCFYSSCCTKYTYKIHQNKIEIENALCVLNYVRFKGDVPPFADAFICILLFMLPKVCLQNTTKKVEIKRKYIASCMGF